MFTLNYTILFDCCIVYLLYCLGFKSHSHYCYIAKLSIYCIISIFLRTLFNPANCLLSNNNYTSEEILGTLDGYNPFTRSSYITLQLHC